MKLQEYNGRYHLSLPVKLVEAFGWKKGRELNTEIGKDRSLIIKEKQ
jgi:hypothetical protein